MRHGLDIRGRFLIKEGEMTLQRSFIMVLRLVLLLFLFSKADGGKDTSDESSMERRDTENVEDSVNSHKNVSSYFCDKPSSYFSKPSSGAKSVRKNVVPSADGVVYNFFDDALDVASCACSCERNSTCNAALWAENTCVFVGCSFETSAASCDDVSAAGADVGQTIYVLMKTNGSSLSIASTPSFSKFSALKNATPTAFSSISSPLTSRHLLTQPAMSASSSAPVTLSATPNSSMPSVARPENSSETVVAFTFLNCVGKCPPHSSCVMSDRRRPIGRCVCDPGFSKDGLANKCVADVARGVNNGSSSDINRVDLLTNEKSVILNSKKKSRKGELAEPNTVLEPALSTSAVSTSSAPVSTASSLFRLSLSHDKSRRVDVLKIPDSTNSTVLNPSSDSGLDSFNSAAVEQPFPKSDSSLNLSAVVDRRNMVQSKEAEENISSTVTARSSSVAAAVVPSQPTSTPPGSMEPTGVVEVPSESSIPRLTLPSLSPTPSSSPEAPGPPPLPRLVVSAGDARVLQLPEQSVSITAFALPKPEEGKKDMYEYSWTLISHPKPMEGKTMGKIEGVNKVTVVLKDLIEGLYRLKVVVTDKSSTDSSVSAEAFVNVTILPPKRINQAPVAVINPTSLEVKEGNTAILDGSQSLDDDKIETFKWEEIEGPMETQGITGEKSMLKLDHLTPGEYRFKLTVVDSDGVSNSTSAHVKVNKEKDYPPKADAGSDKVVTLPQREVVIAGNRSSDDKGIASYEWSKTEGGHTPEMTGVHTAFLHLAQLEVGTYTFTLTVTDTGGNQDHADVHVYVKEKPKEPLKADAGHYQRIMLPKSSVELDGSNSTILETDTGGSGAGGGSGGVSDRGENGDETRSIVAFHWSFVSLNGKASSTTMKTTKTTVAASVVAADSKSKGVVVAEHSVGDVDVKILSPDKLKTTVEGLKKPGKYLFELVVTDDKRNTAKDTVEVVVLKPSNVPPKADAGKDQVIILPSSFIKLDGSKSSDDKGIETYEWTRDISSPAAGEVIGNSFSSPVLLLSNLVPGRYQFHLKVKDKEGLSSSASTTVVVKSDPYNREVLEINLDADLASFTEGDKLELIKSLQQLLAQPTGDILIKIHHIYQDRHSGRVIVIFHVELITKEVREMLKGPAVVERLKVTMRNSASSSPSGLGEFPYPISRIDTVVCQNKCSGHGRCSIFNKRCICDAFWMENFFKARPSGAGWMNVGKSNCDWSILYVVIIILLVVIVIAAIVWSLIVFCCCRRYRPYRSTSAAKGRRGSSASRHLLSPKKSGNHRYALLDDFSDKNGGGQNEEQEDSFVKMTSTKRANQSSSLMISESGDFTSEEETVFETSRLTNSNGEPDQLRTTFSNGGLVHRVSNA